MRIFLAVTPYNKVFDLMKKNKVKNLLISYAYYKSPEMYKQVSGEWFPENLMIDSGAFTVWTRNEKVDIDKYIEFCKGMAKIAPENCNLYVVNLDVLPGNFGRKPTVEERQESAEQGWKNLMYLKNQGLNKVIHVFHQHEDFKWLYKMIDVLDYIGISPANDVSMDSKLRWLNEVFRIVRNNCLTHGFAVTSHRQLLNYPFYSADSSSWLVGGRYGVVPVFKEGRIKMLHYKTRKKISDLFNVSEIKDIALLENYLTREEQGILAYQQLEDFVNKVWDKRGIKPGVLNENREISQALNNKYARN